MSLSIASAQIRVRRVIPVEASGAATALDLFEGDTMFDPKWGVLAVALIVFAMAASYDMQLGYAAGAGLGMLALIYIGIRYLFSFEPLQAGSKRGVLANRLSRLTRNRRKAAKTQRLNEEEFDQQA